MLVQYWGLVLDLRIFYLLSPIYMLVSFTIKLKKSLRLLLNEVTPLIIPISKVNLKRIQFLYLITAVNQRQLHS